MKHLSTIIILSLVVIALFIAWQIFGGGLFKNETKIITNHDIVLEQVETLGKMELVKFKFKDVLEHKVEYSWWPDSKAVLIISGEAVGCIDLSKVKKENITDGKDTLYLRLPAPEICYSKINHKDSRVYNTQSYSFDQTKLVEQAYKEAEKQIQKTALQSNILEQTRTNADKILKPMFEQLTKKKVILTYELAQTDEKIKKM